MRFFTLLPLVAGLSLASTAPAQDADDLIAKYEAEISEKWVSHGGWTLDLDEALARAKKENKLVFAYFTRSYAP
ncbi:MAG TPA: hypothetical protein DDW23_05565 [Planctomycetes bacterium]|nr:hypothetical protein [Planctomycetota bacterium]|tara:strand:+ start:413 stop:634 length:222 start_codon:yes stop_codon:yes gene_type:complete